MAAVFFFKDFSLVPNMDMGIRELYLQREKTVEREAGYFCLNWASGMVVFF